MSYDHWRTWVRRSLGHSRLRPSSLDDSDQGKSVIRQAWNMLKPEEILKVYLIIQLPERPCVLCRAVCMNCLNQSEINYNASLFPKIKCSTDKFPPSNPTRNSSQASFGHQLHGVHHHIVGKGCPWWRHQMETFSASLALCEGNHWWPVIPLTKASDTKLWCFLWSATAQMVE